MGCMQFFIVSDETLAVMTTTKHCLIGIAAKVKAARFLEET